MNTRSINPKFFNFLAISKDIAMTEGVKRKIKSSLSLESEEITEIKQILYSPKARVDDYEFAYNYFDRELNLFKYARKDPVKYASSSYHKDADINPIIKNAKEVIIALCTIGSLIVTAYVSGGKK